LGERDEAAAKQEGAQRFLETYYRHPTQQREHQHAAGEEEIDLAGDFGIGLFDWDAGEVSGEGDGGGY
jgi:hypothetical protein